MPEASVPRSTHFAPLSKPEQRARDPLGRPLLFKAFLLTYLDAMHLQIVATKECR